MIEGIRISNEVRRQRVEQRRAFEGLSEGRPGGDLGAGAIDLERTQPMPKPNRTHLRRGRAVIGRRPANMWSLAGVLFIFLNFASSTMAGDLENGVAAYNRSDSATAWRLLRPLAEQGDARAQALVGNMYARSLGVTYDGTEAVRWWRKAAEEGAQVAHWLRMLGFIVQDIWPVRQGLRECQFSSVRECSGQTNKLLRLVFPNDSPPWSRGPATQERGYSQLECEEVARLWRLWKRCPPDCRCKNDSHTS